MIPEDLFSNCDEMISLLHRKIELMGELKRSLRLLQLLGMSVAEAKERKITSRLVGSGRGPTYLSNRPWLEFDYVVSVDGVDVLRKSLKDVHLDLWRPDIRADYEAFVRRKAQKEQASA